MDGSDDSSSEDEDYKPTAKEMRTDEEEQTRSKRHKSNHKPEAASPSGASAGGQPQERGNREPQVKESALTYIVTSCRTLSIRALQPR